MVHLFGLEVTEPRNIRLTRRTRNCQWLVCYYHNTHVSVLPWARAETSGGSRVRPPAPEPPGRPLTLLTLVIQWVTRLSEKAHM
jgi:hypothetical protein